MSLQKYTLSIGSAVPPVPYAGVADASFVRDDFYLASEADAEIARLKADAERYRWLRENCRSECEDSGKPQLINPIEYSCNWRRELDDAIDAAMQSGKERDAL